MGSEQSKPEGDAVPEDQLTHEQKGERDADAWISEAYEKIFAEKREKEEKRRLAAEENERAARNDRTSQEAARQQAEIEAANADAARKQQNFSNQVEPQARNNAAEGEQSKISQTNADLLAKQNAMKKKVSAWPDTARSSKPEPSRPANHASSEASKATKSNALEGWGSRKQPQGGQDAFLPQNQAAQPRRQSSDSEGDVIEVSPRPKNVLRVEKSNGKAGPPAKATTSSKPTAPQSASKQGSVPSKRKIDPSGSGLDISGRIPKRSNTSMSTSQSPRSPPSGALGSSADDRLNGPAWYQNTSKDKSAKARRDQRDNGGAELLLQQLKTLITKAKEAHQKGQSMQEFQSNVRGLLHKLFFATVNEKLLKNNNMLNGNNGIAQLFDSAFSGEVPWEWDIKSDAEELYNKWCRRDFDTDLMRGIRVGTAADHSADKIEANYDKKVPAHYRGNGLLLNGQWWPTQLTALRDGAHGVSQGGICGKVGEGAFSVIMSGGHNYPDVDDGDEVLYCGTDSKDGSITSDTQRLIESYENKWPVRLIRSSKMSHSKWAPPVGFRYDGLYNIEGVESLSPPGRRRFKLIRCANQDPIRGGDTPAARPTKREVEALDKHKKLARGKCN